RVEVALHVILNAFEQPGAAGDDQLARLLVVEQAEDHASEQEQQGEQRADMDVKRKAAFTGSGLGHRASLLGWRCRPKKHSEECGLLLGEARGVVRAVPGRARRLASCSDAGASRVSATLPPGPVLRRAGH